MSIKDRLGFQDYAAIYFMHNAFSLLSINKILHYPVKIKIIQEWIFFMVLRVFQFAALGKLKNLP